MLLLAQERFLIFFSVNVDEGGYKPVQMDLTTDTQKQTARWEKGSSSANKFFVGRNNNDGGYLDPDISEEPTAFICNDSEIPK
jgi:hypothetical protein